MGATESTMLSKTMLSKTNWAVVGDVMNKSKPAFRVVQKLRDNGKEVYLINSRDPDNCLSSLLDVPNDVDIEVVNLIVNPKVSKFYLFEVVLLE